MPNITLFTMGTRGDVQPYIYLSRALNRAGFHVTLGSHPCWRSLIESSNISFVPIGPDIDIEKETTVIRGKNSNPVISMLSTMNFIFRIIENSTNDVYNACKGSDLVIVTHSQIGATEAEALKIPTVNVTLQTQMIPQKQKKTKFTDKIIGSFIGAQAAKPYNKIRKIYGLKKLKASDEIMMGKINLIPISRYVTPRNQYWEDKHIMTGYWYEDEPDYIPDKSLSDFLKSGERPVILALGAMSFETQSEREKLDMFVNAFKKTGMRAVIQGFNKTLEDYELPDTMIRCGSVPHSWLFGQGWCVIHHCGFGTAAASMIYGIPSVPVPHVLDQMGFADELYKCGAAVKPINARDLSEERVTEAIKEMQNTYSEKSARVREISEKIRSENGLETAVKHINEIISEMK